MKKRRITEETVERKLHVVHNERMKRKNFWVSIMSLGVDPGGDG